MSGEEKEAQHVLAFLKLNKRPDQDMVCLSGKSGYDILVDPLQNKGSAASKAERERMGLRGLVPPMISSMEAQAAREMEEYMHGHGDMQPEEGGVTTEEDTRKWRMLQALQDRNATLFYRILLDNFVKMAPIVYDPTVGWACQNYHKLYKRPRGFYVSAEDRGEMASMVWNWPSSQVDAIVVTDGSRILGLGDLGLNGLGIPVGKLDLYVGAAGFHPARVMPAIIDVGTNNEALRNDPLYLGLKQPRINGPVYYEIVDEFVAAVLGRWPRAVLQFEDFEITKARPLLDRYRNDYLVFNDDIQGTAAVTLAGLFAAMLAQGKPVGDITKQRYVMVGAGSAGTGIADLTAEAMAKHGMKKDDAAKAFWLTDEHGLLTKSRKDDSLSDVARYFAREPQKDDKEGEKLLDTVKRVKPTVIIGVAAAGHLFTDELLKALADANERPIIFALSNPNSKMECTAADAQKATGGRALFGSGVPQEDVKMNGKTILNRQANNMLIYPGLALGAHLGATGIITDLMMVAAAEALPQLVPKEDLQRGALYPTLDDVRSISRAMAVAVMQQAAEQGHLHSTVAQGALQKGGEKALEAWVDVQMYYPDYVPYARRPT